MTDYRITMLRAPFFRWHGVIIYSDGTQVVCGPFFNRSVAREKTSRVADAFRKWGGR